MEANKNFFTPLELRRLLRMMLVKYPHFGYRDRVYIQTTGIAMGQPLSATIATLYMEELETEFATKTSVPCLLWKRCMDDILAIVPATHVDNALTILNSLRPSIKFTLERETDRSIPFLDLRLTRLLGSINISVYRKPTHTDQYLAFDSNHPIQHKRAVVAALVRRATTIPSTSTGRSAETRYVQQVLSTSGYPRSVVDYTPRRPSRPRPLHNATVTLPYVRGLSEPIVCEGLSIMPLASLVTFHF